ncbi:MAG: alanine--glyoxylate aminotransferase family protein [Verrucomicrobia bacterium]|nr:alanine--glyoxylate aminotransferase family protein [Verrucomicrobiota bacterium]
MRRGRRRAWEGTRTSPRGRPPQPRITLDTHTKLFIPGPVEVSAKTLAAFARPVIGHRGSDFVKLYESLQGPLRDLFQTKQMVMLSTSSAWGIMEGAIRNLVRERVLCCMCGAFSDKWLDVAQRCGKQAEALQVPWGQPITGAAVAEKLATGKFDAVTLIHNETSTGVLNPLAEIAAAVRQFPNVVLIVDSVSSFSAVPIATDELGIDLLLTGSQKALALPPGLSLFTCSDRAFERAKSVEGRGYYFDLLEFKKNAEANMTPSTPSVSHIYALQSKLEDIAAEGIAARHARHEATNTLVHDWVRRQGFDFFAPEGFRSKSLTCVANSRGIDVADLVSKLKKRHRLAIDGGYGQLKGKTFRLSNMGDETVETVGHLLACLDDCLAT